MIQFKKHSNIYCLTVNQDIKVPIDVAWSFFSNPNNLQEITPNDMDFKITNSPSEEMYSGQIITYKIKLLPFYSASWVTEIKAVTPLESFIDEQRFGPYSMWHHTHLFKETKDGTTMTDQVYFKIPFGFLGRIAYRLFIKKKLKSIFTYREKMVNSIFK